MRVAIVMVAVWAMAPYTPASAQVMKPQLTVPPCTSAHNCPNYKPGAALPPPGATQGPRIPCHAGTVYNPKRGTCKVVGTP